MTMSEQLSKLSARTKELEDRAAAARTKAREDLEQEVKAARESVQANAESIHESVENDQAQVAAWWNDLGRAWDQHVATVREHIDDKKAAHDLKAAQRAAEEADDYATYLVGYTYAAVEEAEYAVLDAVLAHTYADELAAQASSSNPEGES
jgi:hypothetical protein